MFSKRRRTLEDHDKVAILWRKMSNTVEKLNKLFGKVETQVSQKATNAFNLHKDTVKILKNTLAE